MDGPNEPLDWLRFNALELRPTRAKELLRAFGETPARIFAASPAERSISAPWLTSTQQERIDQMGKRDFSPELTLLEKIGGSIVLEADPCYPASLRQLPDSPPMLIVRGALLPEDKFSVAIVGSRQASEYGLSLARRFASELCGHGLAIVSGGARGVDAQAHRGALEGGGRTIAFVGSGVDVPYPSEHKMLFAEIAEGRGAIVSEFPLRTQPEPWRFPARNRLISGMALGVLVIESPRSSGSMITAREAADQGRDVFAIPGPIGDGRSSGCHQLIQDGAKLVESVDDILTELGLLALTSPEEGREKLTPPPPTNLAPELRRILDLLTLSPRHVDSLVGECGLSVPQVTGALTLLEMKGLARRIPGNAFVRVL